MDFTGLDIDWFGRDLIDEVAIRDKLNQFHKMPIFELRFSETMKIEL